MEQLMDWCKSYDGAKHYNWTHIIHTHTYIVWVRCYGGGGSVGLQGTVKDDPKWDLAPGRGLETCE